MVSLAISVPGLTERANRYLSNPLQAAELTRAGIIAGAPPSIETVEQMGDAMRRFFMLTAIAATALATGQAAMADNRPDGPRPECRQNDRDCPPPPPKDAPRKAKRNEGKAPPPPAEVNRGEHKPRPAEAPPRNARTKHTPDGRKPLRVGDSIRDGRPFQRASTSRFAPPPPGQEYRVVHDQVVLVDKKTKRIVQILGPVNH